MSNDLTPTRPYLLRAMHEWMTDNGQTPLIVVDAERSDVAVPTEHVEDGHIVLNISWSATRNLQMDNESVCFDARFSGVAHAVSVPMEAIQGIYARESGQGMMFHEEPAETGSGDPGEREDSSADSSEESAKPGSGKRPDLRIVK